MPMAAMSNSIDFSSTEIMGGGAGIDALLGGGGTLGAGFVGAGVGAEA